MDNLKILQIVSTLLKPTLTDESFLEFSKTLKIEKKYTSTVTNAPHSHIQQSVDFIVNWITSSDYNLSKIGSVMNDNLFFANSTEFKTIFIDEKWLTSYEAEGDFVKVIDFQGDSWFEDFPNQSGQTIPNRYEVIEFHIGLTKRYSKEKNPLKRRELAFSIYILEQRFKFKYLISSLRNTYYLFQDELIEVVNNNIKNVNKYQLEKRLRTLTFPTIGEWFEIKSFLYPLVTLGLFIFMYPFSQMDLEAPTLLFSPLVYEIGFDVSPYDYIVFDSEGYSDVSFYNNISIINFDRTKLSDPNTFNYSYIITDLNNNSRRYPTSMVVQDTTKPIINSTSQSLIINFNELSGFDFLKFIEVTDNHQIIDIAPIIPQSLLDPLTYYPIGKYTLEFRVKDASANKSSYKLVAVVVDTVPPNLQFYTNNPMFPIENYNESSLPGLIKNITDNYRTDLVTLSISDDYIVDTVGVYTVTFIATDANNNSTTKRLQFEVYDRIPPIVEFLDYKPVISITDTKLMTFTPEQFIISASDNYRIKSITASDTSSPFVLRQFFDYVVSVEDYGGNVTSKKYRLILLDTIPPKINLLTDYENYNPGFDITDPIPNSTIQRLFVSSLQDNFRGTVLFDVIWPINIYRGENLLTLVATDSSGNTSTTEVILNLT